MDNIVLKINDLSVEYRTDNGIVKALNSVNLTIGRGETLGLVGETGAGKTTTALSILRLIANPPGKIVKGEIIFEGEDLLKKSSKEMEKTRGNKISMIFQDPMTTLNPVLTIGEQIAEVIRLHQKISRNKANIKAGEMLELVGISLNRFGEYPHQFSGGMKQRVVIAIALACNPNMLIADEPTTALDVTIQAQVIELMIKLKKQLNNSMLIITHDLGVVAEICDKVAIMYAGEIVEYGTLEQIYRNPTHPYTKGLFACIPSISKKIRRLNPIKGLMPDPTKLPKGCSFHPRCPYKTGDCEFNNPIGAILDDGHYIKCILVEK